MADEDSISTIGNPAESISTLGDPAQSASTIGTDWEAMAMNEPTGKLDQMINAPDQPAPAGFSFDQHMAGMDALHQSIANGEASQDPQAATYAENNPDVRGRTINGVTYPGYNPRLPDAPNVPGSVEGRTQELESGLDALEKKSTTLTQRPDTRFTALAPQPRPGVQVQPAIPPSPVPTASTTQPARPKTRALRYGDLGKKPGVDQVQKLGLPSLNIASPLSVTGQSLWEGLSQSNPIYPSYGR